jgi:hypothetical protein
MVVGLGQHLGDHAALTGHAHAALGTEPLKPAFPCRDLHHSVRRLAVPLVDLHHRSPGSKGKAEDGGVGAMLVIGLALTDPDGAKR